MFLRAFLCIFCNQIDGHSDGNGRTFLVRTKSVFSVFKHCFYEIVVVFFVTAFVVPVRFSPSETFDVVLQVFVL